MLDGNEGEEVGGDHRGLSTTSYFCLPPF